MFDIILDSSKAALNMLTAQLALEFPNVLSVAIRPGVVKTDMIASILNEGNFVVCLMVQ